MKSTDTPVLMSQAAAAISRLGGASAVQDGMEIIIEAATQPHSVKDLCAALIAYRDMALLGGASAGSFRRERRTGGMPVGARSRRITQILSEKLRNVGDEAVISEILDEMDRDHFWKSRSHRLRWVRKALEGIVLQKRRIDGRDRLVAVRVEPTGGDAAW